jgi:hypothetical protein
MIFVKWLSFSLFLAGPKNELFQKVDVKNATLVSNPASFSLFLDLILS